MIKKYFFLKSICVFILFFCCFSIFAQEDNPVQSNKVIIKITTTPLNAEVYIGNKFVGVSPLNKIRAPKGTYPIIIYKKNYKIIKQKIKITENDQTFNFILKRKPWKPKSNNISTKFTFPFFSKFNIENKFSIFFSYKYFFKELTSAIRVDFEFEVGIVNLRRKFTLDSVKDAGETPLHIVPVTLMFHLNFFHRFGYISPYIGAGMGTSIINQQAGDYEKTSLTFSLMAGINFFTKWPVSFLIEIRYTWFGMAKLVSEATTSGSDINITKREEKQLAGFLFTVGLVIRF